MNLEQEWRKWVASRPPQIQAAIKKFPLKSEFDHGGEHSYLIGRAEQQDSDEVTLIFSKTDPSVDYDTAQANRIYICAKHFEREEAP